MTPLTPSTPVAAGHDELSEHLNAFLDGNLEPPLRNRVAAHVAGCARCALELNQLRATRLALQALPALRAPRPFTVVSLAPAPRRVWLAALLPWTWRAGALATAACLLLALVSAGGGAQLAQAPAASRANEAPKAQTGQGASAFGGAAGTSSNVSPSGPTAAQPVQATQAPAPAPQVAQAPAAAPAPAGQAAARAQDASRSEAQSASTAAVPTLFPSPTAVGSPTAAALAIATANPAPLGPTGAARSRPQASSTTSLWLGLAAVLAACSTAAYLAARRLSG